jgi:hypothetical protein
MRSFRYLNVCELEVLWCKRSQCKEVLPMGQNAVGIRAHLMFSCILEMEK